MATSNAGGTDQTAGDARVVEAQSHLGGAATRLDTAQQWREFLTLAGHNQHMSAANLLLLWDHHPTAGPVDSVAGWRARGRDIRADARGTTVLTAMPNSDPTSSRRWRTAVVYGREHTTNHTDNHMDEVSSQPATPTSAEALLRKLHEHAQRTGWTLQLGASPSRDPSTITLPTDAGTGQHCHMLASHLAHAAAGTDLSSDWIARAATELVTRRAGLEPTTALPDPPAAPDGSTPAAHARELATRLVRTARTLDPPPSQVSNQLAARVHTARARATETRERAELGAGSSAGPTRPTGGTKQLAHANEAAARYFGEQLHRSNAASSYLTFRIGADVDQLPAGWRVGYAPPGWTALRDHLRERGFNDETLLAAGLAQRSQRGGIIDRFHHRLMVGVHNQHDQVTGFTGRTLHPDEETTRKYLNTPTGALYDKSNDLLGITEQRGALADGTRQPLLVEGPLDALALAVRDPADRAWAPISTSGTAVTPTQLNHIHASSSAPLTIGLDADDAGRTATDRITRLTYADPARDTRVLELPDGHDPASYLAAGGNPSPDETTGAADWLLGHVLERHRQLEHPDWVPQQAATLEDAAALLAPLPTSTAATLATRLAAELDQLPLDTVTSRVVQAHVDARGAPQRATTTASSNSGAESASAPSTTAPPSTRPPTAHQPHTTAPRARPTTPT